MGAESAGLAPLGAQPAFRIGRRSIALELPKLNDPRLQLAAVIVTLQVLGQTVLKFQVSIAQILVAVGTCAVLEIAITLFRRATLAWPASALLTGNSVAFLLRTPNVAHGQWWDLSGAGIFAGTAAISILSKYVFRFGGRHVFNPSNVGLLACFLILGTGRANPQDLWWGATSIGLDFTLVVIVLGGLAIVARLQMLGLALGFWLTFAAGTGVLALSGHCMRARWHVGPICGESFWSILAFSPEVLVFLFFMITDPKTASAGRVARALFGVGVGLVGALLIAPMGTEFETKVALLGGLAVLCILRRPIERLLPAAGSDGDHLLAWLRRTRPAESQAGSLSRRGASVVTVASLSAAALLLAGTPARPTTAALVAPPGVRPVLVLPRSVVPPVSIDPSVTNADPTLTPTVGRAMATDVVTDLLIIDDALQTHSARLAGTAAAGLYLAAAERTISHATGTATVEIPRFQFTRLAVVLVRDPKRPQNSPNVGILAVGTIFPDRFSGSPEALVSPSGGKPYRATFVIEFDGAHYLIASAS